jgi:hypothetical protein
MPYLAEQPTLLLYADRWPSHQSHLTWQLSHIFLLCDAQQLLVVARKHPDHAISEVVHRLRRWTTSLCSQTARSLVLILQTMRYALLLDYVARFCHLFAVIWMLPSVERPRFLGEGVPNSCMF